MINTRSLATASSAVFPSPSCTHPLRGPSSPGFILEALPTRQTNINCQSFIQHKHTYTENICMNLKSPRKNCQDNKMFRFPTFLNLPRVILQQHQAMQCLTLGTSHAPCSIKALEHSSFWFKCQSRKLYAGEARKQHMHQSNH